MLYVFSYSYIISDFILYTEKIPKHVQHGLLGNELQHTFYEPLQPLEAELVFLPPLVSLLHPKQTMALEDEQKMSGNVQQTVPFPSAQALSWRCWIISSWTSPKSSARPRNWPELLG